MADPQIKSKLLHIFKGSNADAVDELAPRLARIPAERLLFLTGVGAGLTGLSIRAALDFFRAAPEVGALLTSFELQAWGEAGKRIASTNIEAAQEFFVVSAETLKALPKPYRMRAITLCTKQATLSTRIAVDTFKTLPTVVAAMGDTPVLQRLFIIANEVARYSVKHSHDLLQAAPRVTARLAAVDSADGALTAQALDIAAKFVHRSGGTAAEFFLSLPEVLSETTRPHVPRILEHTDLFLERSGGMAMHFLRAAAELLKIAGADTYEQWLRLSLSICAQGNANSYQFLKLTPEVVRAVAANRSRERTEKAIQAVLAATLDISRYNPSSALECFKSAGRALERASPEQFSVWARRGLELHGKDARAAAAYYGLQSRTSRETLASGGGGLTLESVIGVLRLYVEGLTGRTLAVTSLKSHPEHAKIGDGATVALPDAVADFPDAETNFRLFKVLAAHGAGQIEYGTHAEDTPSLRAAYSEIVNAYGAPPRRRTPVTFSVVLRGFPDPDLATRIFTTLENARIDRRLRRAYRGIRRDLDFVQARLRESRPNLAALAPNMIWQELLFQIALCGGPSDEARRDHALLLFALEAAVADYLENPDADVGDAVRATQRIYELAQQRKLEADAPETDVQNQADADRTANAASAAADREPDDRPAAPESRTAPPPGESFQAWASERPDAPPMSDLVSGVAKTGDVVEHKLEPNDKIFLYDEWDRELGDFRIDWCRVIERRQPDGSRTFVETARARHRGLISSVRHQFQLMKPENLRRVSGELDGEEFDLEAAVSNAIDRRAAGVVTERLYIKRLRRQRDVAVAFLLDMSSSTARIITRNPTMPYTRPGQRIIDIEKEGLVLMNEALEAVGDRYAIYGFTSEGRRNVRFYVIKEFHERYDASIERRIGGVNYQNNTRLGAAVRHATSRLVAQDARTKLLILLSDGRPYDHDYGDARYAREDTKLALRQAQANGVTSFCITIEREAETELKDLYGEVGFTIIDDVMSLPEKLPGIYRRLTT
jgi:nitric oxide reductase NorD protein